MEEITDIVRESIPPLIRDFFIMRAELLGEDNLMNMRVAHFNSLSDLAEHYEDMKPLYAFVHAVRFRNPETAYTELTGYRAEEPSKKKTFILQDRFGQEWCWADDNAKRLREPSTWFGPTIRKVFSDYEIIDVVFGKPNFGATFSGPVRYINVRGYRGRISRPETSSERQFDTLPSFA